MGKAKWQGFSVRRVLAQAFFDVLLWTSIYFGFVEGVSGVANIALFIMWWTIIVGTIVVFALADGSFLEDKDVEELRRLGTYRGFKKYYRAVTITAESLAFVYFGYPISGGLYLFVCLMLDTGRKMASREELENRGLTVHGEEKVDG